MIKIVLIIIFTFMLTMLPIIITLVLYQSLLIFFFFSSLHHNGADVLMTCASYLHYPVFGQQAGALSWRALVHGSDVLARPCALAVQIEAISVGASLDHTEPWPQLGALLLDGDRPQREADRQKDRRVNTFGTVAQNPKLFKNYLHHVCLLRENQRHKDDGELL